MTNLKFRAWDEDGFMFIPTKIEFNKLHEGDTWVWNGEEFGQLGSAVIDLMQWTGLTDKNGKEIYEGDIVKYIPNSTLGIVVWSDSHCRFDICPLNYNYKEEICRAWEEEAEDNCTDYVVIGNEHENKELLK